MTLKEIEKIIDESDAFLFKDGDRKCFVPLNHQGAKDSEKGIVDHYIERGCSYIFYKHDDNGGVEKSWIVDHIDKEKKIVKKKLGDMTYEEIEQVEAKYCKPETACSDCPLFANNNTACIAYYARCKKQFEAYKNRMFEIEVEE